MKSVNDVSAHLLTMSPVRTLRRGHCDVVFRNVPGADGAAPAKSAIDGQESFVPPPGCCEQRPSEYAFDASSTLGHPEEAK
jgi:hypothetical protein